MLYIIERNNLFHVGSAELFHDDSRAKMVITILNQLQRIDFGVMKRVFNVTGSNRGPFSLSIDKKTLIHGGMDNFDHTEVTSS